MHHHTVAMSCYPRLQEIETPCLELLPSSQSPFYLQVKDKKFKWTLQAVTYQSSVFPVPGQTVCIQSMLLSVIINSAKFQEI